MNLRKRIDKLSPPASASQTIIAEAPDWMPDGQITAAIVQLGHDEPFDLIALKRLPEDCSEVSVHSTFSAGIDALLADIAKNGRRIGEKPQENKVESIH